MSYPRHYEQPYSQQHPYAAHPPYGYVGQQPAVNDGSGVSAAALILGICAVLFNVLLIPSILAIVLGSKGRAQSLAATGRRNGMATAGFLMGWIMLIISALVMLVIFLTLFLAVPEGWIEPAEQEAVSPHFSYSDEPKWEYRSR